MKQFSPQRLDFLTDNALKARQVACGYGFTVLLCRGEGGEDVVYGTGINTDSQLGYHEYPRKSGRLLDFVIEPVRVDLPLLWPDTTRLTGAACGRAHTLIQTDSEGVFSLGNNAYGQCGRPVVTDEVYSSSQLISRVDLDKDVKQMVCGQDHSLFLTTDGQVYSCGLGADGQTGLGHYDAVGTPTRVEGDIATQNIVQLSSKADTVLAVSERGEVFGWGNSEYGQLTAAAGGEMQVNSPLRLPLPDGVGRVTKVVAAGSMCAALNDDGAVYVWGYGLLGKGPRLHTSPVPSGIPPSLFGRNEFNADTRVIDLQATMHGFAAVTNQGDLFVWGRNKTGCLGLGNILDQFFPFKVLVPAEVRSVACGVDHMVALCTSFA